MSFCVLTLLLHLLYNALWIFARHITKKESITGMHLLMYKEKLGSKSEKTPKQTNGQMSLFNEAKLEADASV